MCQTGVNLTSVHCDCHFLLWDVVSTIQTPCTMSVIDHGLDWRFNGGRWSKCTWSSIFYIFTCTSETFLSYYSLMVVVWWWSVLGGHIPDNGIFPSSRLCSEAVWPLTMTAGEWWPSPSMSGDARIRAWGLEAVRNNEFVECFVFPTLRAEVALISEKMFAWSGCLGSPWNVPKDVNYTILYIFTFKMCK